MAFHFFHRARNKRGGWQHGRRLLLERLEERALPSGYNQLDLAGYQPGMGRYTDPNLNGWGMDIAPDGSFCVANNATGVATFYDPTGQVLPQVIIIPAPPSLPAGSPSRPTGVVYNPTSDFVISENCISAPAEFLFDSRDGIISGWNPAVDPNHALLVVDNSTEAPKPADYTGLVIAQNSQGQNVLYAADFRNNRIDMFGGSFQALGSFTDSNVASQYPGHTIWQVEDVNGQLFVTFAAHKPGPYGGVIDVFDTDGNLLTPNHFAANAPGAGPLENPWGIVQAPADSTMCLGCLRVVSSWPPTRGGLPTCPGESLARNRGPHSVGTTGSFRFANGIEWTQSGEIESILFLRSAPAVPQSGLKKRQADRHVLSEGMPDRRLCASRDSRFALAGGVLPTTRLRPLE
jgi:uncharacterized protein (TIGR03118 family)